MRGATKQEIRLRPLDTHAAGGYLVASALVAITTVVLIFVQGYLSTVSGERIRTFGIVFLLSVAFVTYRWGIRQGVFALLLSLLSSAFFLMQPRFSLRVDDPRDGAEVIVTFVVGSVILLSLHGLRRERERADALVAASREAQAALQASEEIFRLMVAGVQDYAIFMLDPEGHIVTWNAGAERIKGWRADEIIGKHFSVFYPPDDAQSGRPRQELETATAQGQYREEGWRVRKDGSRFIADVVLTALKSDDGSLRGFSKVTRDITGRKQAEQEIRQLNESLEQRVAERTAQLEETNQEMESFSYTVSHDLRAPLRAIQGFGQALEEDHGDELSPQAHGYLRRMITAAGRMDTLINDLLAYSRLSRAELSPEPVPLTAAVRDALDQVEAQIRERSARIDVQEPLPGVRGHRATLVQVLANLVGNAVKFVPDGAQPQVRVFAEKEDGWVRLWVEDNGIGIAPEHHERIFRVFERLHGMDTYAGTGIGLAIVRKGMERMGGTAGVVSEAGRGSRFWVRLREEPDK